MATKGKMITKAQWKKIAECDRKRILKCIFPHMQSFYESFTDTTDECNGCLWNVIHKRTRVMPDGYVWANNLGLNGLYIK